MGEHGSPLSTIETRRVRRGDPRRGFLTGRAVTATVEVPGGEACSKADPAPGGHLPPAAGLVPMATVRSKPPDAGELHLEAVVADGRGTLVLVGEVDFATAPRVGEAMQTMHAEGVATIVVDLAGLRFIDSSGLQQLVLALKRQRQRDGDVILRSPNASTLRVLEIVGLTKVFRIT